MKTGEQAKKLWCPMARIAQIGAIETSATYNRALIKAHVQVMVADELKKDASPATMLKTAMQVTSASLCLGDDCAMWRWKKIDSIFGHCGLAPIFGVTD